jgi:hypothetical protein
MSGFLLLSLLHNELFSAVKCETRYYFALRISKPLINLILLKKSELTMFSEVKSLKSFGVCNEIIKKETNSEA